MGPLVLARHDCIVGNTAPANPRDQSAAARCGFLRASIRHSHDGHHDRWRVYVKGMATRASAGRVLKSVLHLDAAQHVGPDNANSYFTYPAWRCGFGQMGYQVCRRPSHRRYKATGPAAGQGLGLAVMPQAQAAPEVLGATGSRPPPHRRSAFLFAAAGRRRPRSSALNAGLPSSQIYAPTVGSAH